MREMVKALQTFFSERAVALNDDLRLGRADRRMSIMRRGYDVVRVDFDRANVWAQGEKKTEGFFVCQNKKRKNMFVVFVESKGQGIDYAAKQFKTVRDFFCKEAKSNHNFHGHDGLKKYSGHGSRVYCMLIQSNSIQQHQSKLVKVKQALARHGIIIKQQKGKAVQSLTCDALLKMLH